MSSESNDSGLTVAIPPPDKWFSKTTRISTDKMYSVVSIFKVM